MQQWTRTIFRGGLRSINEHPLLWDFCRAGAPPAALLFTSALMRRAERSPYKATKKALCLNTLHHRTETGELFIKVLIAAVDVIKTIDLRVALGMKGCQHKSC